MIGDISVIPTAQTTKRVMNAVLLYLAGRDLGKSHVAREGHQMKPEANAVAYNVIGVTLALGDDLLFPLELHSDFAEDFFVV